jgi:hypothetical protein
MKSLFSQYGTSGVTRLPLYTNGTENVSWVKGIDSVTGPGDPGSSGGSYVEGGSYITISIFSEPLSLGITVNIAGVTNAEVDLTGYKRVGIDWQVMSEGSFFLIVHDNKNSDYDDFTSRLEFGAGTGRKTSYLPINSLSGSYFVRVNSYASTIAPAVDISEIRIHRVWLEK